VNNWIAQSEEKVDLDQLDHKKEKKISITRKQFVFLFTGIMISSLSDCKDDETVMKNSLRLGSLDSTLKLLDTLGMNPNFKSTGQWDVNRVLHHCAQSIEYSITGYPKNKNILFQKSIGKIVLTVFLSKGYMKHNLAEPIPGAPPLPDPSNDFSDGLERLKNAINSFLGHSGEYAPHFVYGSVNKSDYDKIHAMHIANHFNLMEGL
jgi:hypothetical protein